MSLRNLSSRVYYFGSVILDKTKRMKNGERKEIIIVSLTIYILILSFMQGFISSSANISVNNTIDYIYLPYSTYQIPILTIIAIFYGFGIVSLILYYICTLFYPITEKNDQEEENQYQQKINFSLLANLILTIVPLILLISNFIFSNYYIILKLISFMAFVNFLIPLGIFVVRIKPLIVLESEDSQEIDKLMELTERIIKAKSQRKKGNKIKIFVINYKSKVLELNQRAKENDHKFKNGNLTLQKIKKIKVEEKRESKEFERIKKGEDRNYYSTQKFDFEFTADSLHYRQRLLTKN